MSGARGYQALNPLWVTAPRRCDLPPGNQEHPLPGGRGPPTTSAGIACGRYACAIEASRRVGKVVPAEHDAGPGGWGRASPADVEPIRIREGRNST
jgi:hypothetical protein